MMTANLSDWIAQVGDAHAGPEADGSGIAVPEWITALGGAGEFNDASPFAALEPAAPDMSAHKAALKPAEGSTAAQLQSDWDRGFIAGEAAGRAAAEAEANAAGDQHTALRLAFRSLDQAAMDALAGELTQTVAALCDAALEGYAIDPAAVLERAHKAARRLGTAAQSCTLSLHPDDIEMLEEGALSDWQVTPDAGLERGSIVLAGEEGGVRDGPAEWRRAIAAALRG